MHNSTRNPFTTVRTEGALLPVDLLQRIVAGDKMLGGLDPESYHLPGSEKLNEAINRSWNRLLGAWATFQTSRGRLDEGDAGTTLTRERWLMPLFQELGYGRLQAAKPVTLEGKEYRVSHAWGETPIHLVGCGVNLDRRQLGVTGAAKSSPHSLVQEYLNRNPNQLWGLLSNGLILRVLRDNASLTRQAYLEFDLEAMLTGEVYADFVVLWLTCHQSRVESPEGKPETCRLETWSKAAQEQGTRALDKLRDGVEAAITALGGGFIAHPGNTALKARLRSGALTREGYYRQLLRLAYRLIFLFAAEDRDLLLDPQSSPTARERYMKYYSATHLRQLAEQSRGGRHPDLYATLRLVSAMLGGREQSGAGPKGLGLPVLGSFLFSNEALPDLESAELENSALLTAVRGLAFILDGNARRSVDYRNLGTRELGSVYESLLELHPQINMDAGTFELITAAGNERKTTGSYYTAEDLIKVLLDSALDPVILQAIQRAGPFVEAQIAALLALKVCDSACGSGHFLIAAARRIARRLAQLRSGDEEPSPETIRTALREAIQHCVYGVDINPMSVELCKVNLWLESIEPGKPLSFLDAHIQCGDSLVGVAPGLDISEIPDEAFNPAFGDDKATASALKKRNKAERAGQMGLDIFVFEETDDLKAWMARRAESLDELPEETAEQVGQKAQNYQDYLASPQYRRKKLEYDLWTAAFFWKMETQPTAAGILAPTQEMLRRHRAGGTMPPELVRRVEEMADRLNFLHWELRFPKVFAVENPGFDCMLGNPPWEKNEVEERPFFAAIRPDIAKATNANVRKKLIRDLGNSDPSLFKEWVEYKSARENTDKFYRFSDALPLTAVGKYNLYALFAERSIGFINGLGRCGLIVQTGIATEDTTKQFFQHVSEHGFLVSLYDFENKLALFPGIHRSMRFSLITIAGLSAKVQETSYAFFLTTSSDLQQPGRRFSLQPTDYVLINPNTRNCPVFRNEQEAVLARRIYKNIPVLQKEDSQNAWNIQIKRQFNIADDSALLRTMANLVGQGYELVGNRFINAEKEVYVPLFEAKMMFLYDNRFGTFKDVAPDDIAKGNCQNLSTEEYQDFDSIALPRYWVPEKEWKKIIPYDYSWLLCFRWFTNATNERTLVTATISSVACGDTLPCIYTQYIDNNVVLLLIGNLSSLILDFLARQKLSGTHMNFFILKQLPVIPPEVYSSKDTDFITSRVLELVYTSHELKTFAKDAGYIGKPYCWDGDRRALLRAELDAYYARLYGLTRDELRYILDPQDVYGPDFPGETFRVLKDKEMRLYGEYRTRRLVLEAWDRLEGVGPAAVSLPVAAAAVPKTETIVIESKPVVEKVKEIAASEPAPESQPMLSDFGLYKCGVCGKMVMGFENESHEREKHGGKSVEWKKMR